MKIDVFLIKDSKNQVVNAVHSQSKAEDYIHYHRDHSIQRIEMDVDKKILIGPPAYQAPQEQIERKFDSLPLEPFLMPEDMEQDKLIPLRKLEHQYIKHVIKHCNGNKTHASKVLGVTVKTIYNKLEEAV